jgi:hypothetical protein
MVLRDLSLVIIGLTILSAIVFHQKGSQAESFKCLKCHKGKDSLENLVSSKGIKTADDLRRLVRQGPKAGLHQTSTDEDLELAIKYLNLK